MTGDHKVSIEKEGCEFSVLPPAGPGCGTAPECMVELQLEKKVVYLLFHLFVFVFL